MVNTIYTAAGCNRCKIAKRYMDEQGLAYQELDIQGDGKDSFAQFYRTHRNAIFRGNEGVEFPVFTDGSVIRQGVGIVIAFLHAGTGLDGFIGRSSLSHGWMDGIHVSGGDRVLADHLLQVLGFIRKNGLRLQLDTDGRNASVLEGLLENRLGDRVVMDVKGPLALYRKILGKAIDPEEIRKSMTLVTRFPEYRFQTTVVPVEREEGRGIEVTYLTAEEIAETASLIEEVTGSKKQPYTLRMFDPATCPDERFKSVERLPDTAMFQYRAAARKHQVFAEIQEGD